MTVYRTPLADMRYLLHEVFAAEKEWQAMPRFAHANAELADTVLEEAARLNEKLLAPLNRSGDEEGVHLENGNVRTPAGFREAWATYANNS